MSNTTRYTHLTTKKLLNHLYTIYRKIIPGEANQNGIIQRQAYYAN